uniref:Serpin domain-containing protein n=1 Tax=Moschus moschiferus TaxID=68415 RepID=A0A8C6CT01_MOSMO
MDALSEANGTFALTLLKKLGEDNSNNVFISPLSISSALAMVLVGARGNTAAQMCQVRSGGRFWAAADALSLAGEPVSAIRIPEALLHRLASLPRLTCTQYLLRTTDRLFGEKNMQKPVPMMYNWSTFKITCIAEICSQILVLPYVGQELNMVVVLPNPEIFYLLLQVEKALTYEKFVAWTKPDVLAEEEVKVFLPWFTLEECYDMECVLRSLGMTDAFEAAQADFSGMSCQRGLHLSKVVHKSFLEVTEKGTEAAATSGSRIRRRSLSVVHQFYAERPFLFFIQHGKTGAILFCGRFCSPC